MKTENRGSKKFCSLCGRKIDRLEDYYKFKKVKHLSLGEKIVFIYCRECCKNGFILELKGKQEVGK